MNTERSVWGTYSVADHLRVRPFVADVLLYDQLVIPVPDGDAETERWRRIRRNPDLQKDLVGIMGDLALAIPWSSDRHAAWTSRYAGCAPSAADAGARDDIARGVAFDVSNVAAARQGAQLSATSSSVGVGPTNEVPMPNPDDPAYLMTRMVLADEFDSDADHALVSKIPRIEEVEAVVAYGSYRDFREERGTIGEEQIAGSYPVSTFGWQFLVPASSERSDADLLRESVELAHTDEISAWRAAVYRWRRCSILRHRSDADALRDMELLIKDYAEAARKRKIIVAARWGFAIAAAVGGAAAPFVPLLGLSAVCSIGALVPTPEIPKRLEAAAVFHEARKRFA
jgi:hypothetical protein